VQPADITPQLHAQLEVHAGGRLVEDHEARLMHQRAREEQSPPHAAGQLRGAGVGLRAQVEHVHHLPRPAAGFGARHPVVAAVVHEGFLDVEEPVEVHVLLGQADHPARLQCAVRVSEDLDLAAGDADQVAHGADQRRLAGPVRAEQAEELAVGDLEVERVERQQPVVVALAERAQGQGGSRGHLLRG